MMLEHSLEQRKQRWNALLDGEPGCRRVVSINFDDGLRPRPFPNHNNIKDRMDWAVESYQMQVERMEWLPDDTVPSLPVYTGTEIFAEAFGCKVHYSGDNMPFALPMVSSAAQAAHLKAPNVWDTPLAELFEIAEQLRQRTDKTAVLQIPDIQSPMDITALIWDKNDFMAALLTEPEAVRELSQQVYLLLTQFLDAWFDAFGPEFVAHYPNYYMKSGITLSEDEVGAVSPAVFQSMFYPELAQLSEQYGRIGIHCCANARHQWDNFASIPNLCLINLVQEMDVILDAYRRFETVCAQMPIVGGKGPLESWNAQVPAQARVVFQVSAFSREDALEKLAALRG